MTLPTLRLIVPSAAYALSAENGKQPIKNDMQRAIAITLLLFRLFIFCIDFPPEKRSVFTGLYPPQYVVLPPFLYFMMPAGHHTCNTVRRIRFPLTVPILKISFFFRKSESNKGMGCGEGNGKSTPAAFTVRSPVLFAEDALHSNRLLSG